MSQVKRVHWRLQQEVDRWVHHDDLTSASRCLNIHTAIASLRGAGHVIRCIPHDEEGGSWYMLHSEAGYRRWAAKGFPRVPGETRQRRPGTKPGVAMVCALLNRLYDDLAADDIAIIVKAATSIGADIQRVKGGFAPVLKHLGHD